MDETDASGRVVGHGSGSASTRSGVSARRNISCGRSTPVVGGSTRWCTANVALIRPATPAAAFVWPMLALIEPSTACAAP